jgi:hypothetical protein
VCAGSALLLAKDESTSVVNGALVGVLLSPSASPSVVCLSSPRSTYLGFLTEGKTLLLYSSHLPLGVPNGLVINHASSYFSGAVAGEEVEDFCEGSFSHAHPLLCYLFFFTLFIFTCIVLSKTQKKLESLVVVFTYLLLVLLKWPILKTSSCVTLLVRTIVILSALLLRHLLLLQTFMRLSLLY